MSDEFVRAAENREMALIARFVELLSELTELNYQTGGAVEREACAKLCDELARHSGEPGARKLARDCARAIRERTKTEDTGAGKNELGTLAAVLPLVVKQREKDAAAGRQGDDEESER